MIHCSTPSERPVARGPISVSNAKNHSDYVCSKERAWKVTGVVGEGRRIKFSASGQNVSLICPQQRSLIQPTIPILRLGALVAFALFLTFSTLSGLIILLVVFGENWAAARALKRQNGDVAPTPVPPNSLRRPYTWLVKLLLNHVQVWWLLHILTAYASHPTVSGLSRC